MILDQSEKETLLQQHPESERFLKRFAGSNEHLKGIERWCLWIEDEHVNLANSIEPIKERICSVKKMRLKSDKQATKDSAMSPHAFGEIRYKASESIIIPSVTSERRAYLPAGFLSADTVVSNSAHLILNASPAIFALIISKMHMIWVRATAGQLETRIRYSTSLCYNNFPIPDLTKKQEETINTHAYNVLEEREKHSEKTMAELYDPDKMPDGLREAHHHLDLAVERCYRSKPFTSDEERLEYLFKLYEDMTAKEKLGELL